MLRDTFDAVTVQTADVWELNETARPDDAVALNAKGGEPRGLLPKGVKLIVCVMPEIVMANGCVAFGGIPLLAVKVPAKVPRALGVPAMRPLVALRERPVGRLLGRAENIGAGIPLAARLKL